MYRPDPRLSDNIQAPSRSPVLFPHRRNTRMRYYTTLLHHPVRLPADNTQMPFHGTGPPPGPYHTDNRRISIPRHCRRPPPADNTPSPSRSLPRKKQLHQPCKAPPRSSPPSELLSPQLQQPGLPTRQFRQKQFRRKRRNSDKVPGQTA